MVVDLSFLLSFLYSEVSLVDVFRFFLALALTIVIGVIVILVIFFLDSGQSTSSLLLSTLLWNASTLLSLLVAPALLLRIPLLLSRRTQCFGISSDFSLALEVRVVRVTRSHRQESVSYHAWLDRRCAQYGLIDLSARVYSFARAHHDSAADAAVVFLPKDGGTDIVLRLGLIADGESAVIDGAARKARKGNGRMQDSSIGRITQVLIHLDIVRQLNLEIVTRVANLRDSLFSGDDLLSGESTCALDDTIDVHVAAFLVLAGCPVFAQRLWREGSGMEDVVEDDACLCGGHVELAWGHEVTNDIALLEGQSVVFAVLSGGGGACDASRARC